MSESLPERISLEELQLAARNHALPLEALRWDLTPIGLHYLLTHYDIPDVDPASWRLEVGGLVERPLSLSLDDLRVATRRRGGGDDGVRGERRGHMSSRTSSASPGSSRRWARRAGAGRRSRRSLEEAGIREGAVDVLFTGLDRGVEGGEEQAYERSLPLGALLEGDALLAYEINGVPLPPQHGYPLRLVVPGWYGMTSVKWLARITVLDEPFAGYQMDHSYRVRQDEEDEGEPITTIAPRSLMVPPGIPEFLTRARVVEAGECEIVGRAWSGDAEIAAVDVSTDGGATWAPAELGDARWGGGRGARGASRGTPSPASTSSAAARATRPATSSRSSRRGTSAAT